MLKNLKKKLKQNKIVFNLYQKWQKIDNEFLRFMCYISPTYVSKTRYKRSFFRELDLNNPRTFNEKLMWLKLKKYANDARVIQCADKYEVRKYVEKCGLGHILNELLGVWDKAEDIKWEALPDKFAIKCNHGAGYNLICKDKSKFDTKNAEKQLNEWLKDDFWRDYAEIHYRKIPRKIVCEKYLEGVGDALPVDYKIYCLNGKPLYIGNFIERNLEEHFIRRGYFDLDWKPSPVFKGAAEMEVDKFPKPKCLDEMLSYAKILSKPFPFVRVDFYEVDGKVYFGELTFTPTGCVGTYYTEQADLELGEILDVNWCGEANA